MRTRVVFNQKGGVGKSSSDQCTSGFKNLID